MTEQKTLFFLKQHFLPPPGIWPLFWSTLNKSLLFLTLSGKIGGGGGTHKKCSYKKKASKGHLLHKCTQLLTVSTHFFLSLFAYFCDFFCQKTKMKKKQEKKNAIFSAIIKHDRKKCFYLQKTKQMFIFSNKTTRPNIWKKNIFLRKNPPPPPAKIKRH